MWHIITNITTITVISAVITAAVWWGTECRRGRRNRYVR